MGEVHSELERFSANMWRGHAPGLWLTLRIELGEDADAVQRRFLGVVESWLYIAEPVHQQYGFPCSRERFPTPEDIAPRLPTWLTDDFTAFTEQEVIDSGWRYFYVSWIWAMEERCWNWWGNERDGNSLIVQLQVDGWPCPTEQLAYLARVAGADNVTVGD